MSGRPRLVEEGTPISGISNSDNHGDTAHPRHHDGSTTTRTRPDEQEMMDVTGHHTYYHRPAHATSTVTTGPSSLAQAAASQKSSSRHTDSPQEHHRQRKTQIATRFVIGGEEEEEDHSEVQIDWSSSLPSPPHHHHQQQQHATALASHSDMSYQHVPLTTGQESHPSATTIHHRHHEHQHRHHHHHQKHHQHWQHHNQPTTFFEHHYVIGEEQQQRHSPMHQDEQQHHHVVERMEGVEDHGIKEPLIVMDGANIAYAYADVMAGLEGAPLSASRGRRREPDSRGINVAAKYFLSAGMRVLVVIPAPWFRAKPRTGDSSSGNSLMVTPQLEVLQDLKARGLLVAAPPTDDDDAYAIMIARREDSRAKKRRDQGRGFVLSNDMFRDAVQRDPGDDLYQWLTRGSDGGMGGPGRISFAFCDMGSMDDHGDREMDFVPNPRHPLISWIESHHRSNDLAAS